MKTKDIVVGQDYAVGNRYPVRATVRGVRQERRVWSGWGNNTCNDGVLVEYPESTQRISRTEVVAPVRIQHTWAEEEAHQEAEKVAARERALRQAAHRKTRAAKAKQLDLQLRMLGVEPTRQRMFSGWDTQLISAGFAPGEEIGTVWSAITDLYDFVQRGHVALENVEVLLDGLAVQK